MKVVFFIDGTELCHVNGVPPQIDQVLYFHDLSQPIGPPTLKKYKIIRVDYSSNLCAIAIADMDLPSGNVNQRMSAAYKYIREQREGEPNRLLGTKSHGVKFSYTTYEAQVILKEI